MRSVPPRWFQQAVALAIHRFGACRATDSTDSRNLSPPPPTSPTIVFTVSLYSLQRGAHRPSTTRFDQERRNAPCAQSPSHQSSRTVDTVVETATQARGPAANSERGKEAPQPSALNFTKVARLEQCDALNLPRGTSWHARPYDETLVRLRSAQLPPAATTNARCGRETYNNSSSAGGVRCAKLTSSRPRVQC